MSLNTANSLPAGFDSLLNKTRTCSRYARHALEADPLLQGWLHENYGAPCTRAEIQNLLRQSIHSPQCSPAGGGEGDRVAAATDSFDPETGLGRAIREVRRRVMVKLIFRDLNGLGGLDEVMQAMTALAELCIQEAQTRLMQTLLAQFGTPLGETSGTPQELLVVGMGKLGGGELNVSSDIDLIFLYPEDGKTDGPRIISNHEFFTKLGRRLIAMISEPTADGYVFRVDMRLRPYGDSGPLAMSFAALEEYLVTQGREWERYAWIKARVIAPANESLREHHVGELMQLAQPFVFRKYLDFGAIDSMRKLHAQIRQEVRRRDRLNNIKLGPGGIREIEFTAQVFQLIRGGRETDLRIRPTQQVLRQLAAKGQLSATAVASLDDAYVFLRNLEHRLQYLDDQQTQELPVKPEDQGIIAQAMNFPGYEALLEELARHRAVVSLQFEQIFGEQRDEPQDTLFWHEEMTAEELIPHLADLGYRAAEDSAQRLVQLHTGSRYRSLPELSRQRLDKLIPQFVALSAKHGAPDVTLSRLLDLLESISRRAAYIAFLAEYPEALKRLAQIVSASSWASEYLTQRPALLDELLEAREIYQPPQWQQINSDLMRRLSESAGDTERQLEALHQTKQEQTFRLLAMDLQGLLPVEKLSDHLSDLADLLLSHILKLSWESLRKRHRDEANFAVIAYGKLGGKELGYASDLDLIFLFDDDHPDAQEVYSRLGQRINSLLGSYTSSGRLYETDLRLRPNGASGLLVSSIEAFAEYQQRHAWVWEHQALTRARFSAGSAEIGAKFEDIRLKVLCQPRELGSLRKEILAMRQKMRDAHPDDTGLFDIKHGPGGMVDIEFIVQFIVLAYASRYPRLAANIGNIALLKQAGELGLISAGAASETCALYRTLRQMQHRTRLNNQPSCRLPPGEIDVRASRQLWNELIAGVTQQPGGN